MLFDRSVAHSGLVISTSNKTELLLGYGTLFGDMASALNPISDLYKTQVRQLARALRVPRPIIDKPPSADLSLGQTDEAAMGPTYAEVDQLLVLLVDERYTPDEAANAGFAPPRIRRSGVAFDPRHAFQTAQPADRQAQQAHRRHRL